LWFIIAGFCGKYLDSMPGIKGAISERKFFGSHPREQIRFLLPNKKRGKAWGELILYL